MSDPFSSLKRAAQPGAEPPPPANDAAPSAAFVSPVPEGAPARLDAHSKAGTATTWWGYRDASGALLHWVVRFDPPRGRKFFKPLTLWQTPAGSLEWDWKGPPDPRPLYGQDRLAQVGPVLLVEGERAADRAGELFPDMAVLTWQGGTNATGKADWRPLAGRRVVIWPDNDDAGQKAASAALAMLRGVGAVGRVVEAPWGDLPKAWDLADPFPSGFSLEAAQAAVSEALAAIPQPGAVAGPADPSGVRWPPRFRMEADGLFREVERGEGLERLSDPFEVLGEVYAPTGNGWGLRLRLGGRRAAGREVNVWRKHFVGQGVEVKGELAALGLYLKPSGRSDPFMAALSQVEVDKRFRSLSRTGWAEPGVTYVLPGQVIGRPVADEVIFDGPGINLRFAQRGDLESWRAGIAAQAAGNPLLGFVLALAFVGPLARLMDWQGGGFHLRGSSSCGKTTLAEAAGSVWGGGGELGFAHAWRTTDNALEGLAEGHNDALLVLDELGQVAPEAAGSAAYVLASGQAKARAQAGGGNRTRAEWRVPFLSTGEIGLGAHIATGRLGGDAKAGQELRFLDLEADAGKGWGVWSTLRGVSSAEMSDGLRAVAREHYGWAGPAFVRALVDSDSLAEVKGFVRAAHRAFKDRAHRAGDSSQVGRAADRFAQVAAAGELAARLGVLPWRAGDASSAVRWVFDRWADGFGRAHTVEQRRVFEAARRALEVSAAKFAVFSEETETETAQKDRERLGWRHSHEGQEVFVFHASGWNEVFKPVGGGARAAGFLKAAGFLIVETGPAAVKENRLSRKFRTKGRGYWLRAAFLESDLGLG
ncbi:DUF927 domain-containing protein [Phenylobacterium sp.]|uniref:DUF927 domain-containing protein n=1 Tax=Phenylobacterium sp. TaxID=1871053 RepID=UPI0025FDCBC6|nr:DUF927 domain-containing protein [Phenylobacterium sp.]MCA6311152.1 DUF927 domain-containing protein [Phenylobacterium sp.]MCA6324845.1 DUF927 domain-containing protein [Phenylobacterium sp.]MCA6339565.1 DUF927 domain-containing protein [Phenylobacterium sp.]MCA6346534.1 DUF927 domain-containing protein [Phenylobacterium sp.]MCA6348515.1 DUF927 domain-containing protein [Phenylobacterium sp.]